MHAIPRTSPLRNTRASAPSIPPSDSQDLHIELRGGGHIRVADAATGAVVRLFGPEAQPVLEYNATTGDVRITGPIHRLELEAPKRGLTLASAGDICLAAQGMVRLRGNEGVRVETSVDVGSPTSLLDVAPSGVTIAGNRLAMIGAECHVRVDRGDVSGNELRSTWSHAVWSADRLQITARELRTKVRNCMQTIEDTMTTRAGRMLEWVAGSRYSHAESTEIVSDKDVRIDGTKIHLG